jgi:hypothetical protein
MTPQQAQHHIRKYLEVLADDEKRGGRRDPALLPTSKEEILKAIKLEIAQLYYINSATEERLQDLTRAAMFIDSFTREPLDTASFVEDMQRRRAEIQNYHHELLNVKREDPFFWQRIYALVGISTETKSNTFFDTLKSRLGLGAKPEPTGNSTLFRRVRGRIVLD